MSRGTLFAHLFGFAVLLAATFGLPQAVQAHPGHAHAVHADATHKHAAPANVSAAVQEVVERVEQSMTASAPGAPGHTHDFSCDRGCCAQSSCTACCSAVAPMPPLLLPPSLSTAIGLSKNPHRAGIDGASLRRPPKSFA
jgi:hypothetical protein